MCRVSDDVRRADADGDGTVQTRHRRGCGSRNGSAVAKLAALVASPAVNRATGQHGARGRRKHERRVGLGGTHRHRCDVLQTRDDDRLGRPLPSASQLTDVVLAPTGDPAVGRVPHACPEALGESAAKPAAFWSGVGAKKTSLPSPPTTGPAPQHCTEPSTMAQLLSDPALIEVAPNSGVRASGADPSASGGLEPS